MLKAKSPQEIQIPHGLRIEQASWQLIRTETTILRLPVPGTAAAII